MTSVGVPVRQGSSGDDGLSRKKEAMFLHNQHMHYLIAFSLQLTSPSSLQSYLPPFDISLW